MGKEEVPVGHRGRDRMVVGFTTKYAISAYHHLSYELEYRSGEVYSIKHYVIKFVSDLRQVGSFLLGTPVSSTNKTDCHDITEILLKVALNIITPLTTARDTRKYFFFYQNHANWNPRMSSQYQK